MSMQRATIRCSTLCRRSFHSTTPVASERKFARVNVHSNAVTQLLRLNVESKFEAFKKVYEQPIAKRYEDILTRKMEQRQEMLQLSRKLNRRSRPKHTNKTPVKQQLEKMEHLLATIDDTTHEPLTPEQRAIHDELTDTDFMKPLVGDEMQMDGGELLARIRAELIEYNLINADFSPVRPQQAHETEPRAALRFSSTHKPMDVHNYERPDEARFRERRVVLEVPVDALRLPHRAEERLLDLVGPRFDPSSGLLKLTCDKLPTKGDNKHALLLTLRALLADACCADSNYVPVGDASAPSSPLKQHEQQWLDMLRSTGVDFDPVRLGPAMAPATFLSLLEDDLSEHAARRHVLHSAPTPLHVRQLTDESADPPPPLDDTMLRWFHFERLPAKAERDHAAQQQRALVDALKAAQ